MDRRHPGASQLIRAFPNDVKATDGRGWLPLHWAAVCDHVTVDEVKSIAKADPLAAVRGFNQPISANPGHLIAASRHPDMKVVKCLYDFFPRMAHTRDNEGDLPLHYATRYTQSVEMIQYLIQANPLATKVKGSGDMIPLHRAIYNEDKNSRYRIIKSLLEVDKLSVATANSDGDTVLHLALHNECDLELLKLLVTSNVNVVNARNSGGELPLHKACSITPSNAEKAAILKAFIGVLIDMNPNATQTATTSGAFPAHVAAEHVSTDVFEMVTQCYPGAMNVITEGIGTPLHHAVSASNIQTTQYMLKYFPHIVRVPNKQGYLPIHVAAGRESLEILKAVYYAYPEGMRVYTNSGKLPLHVHANQEFDTDICENDKVADILRFLLKVDPEAVGIADGNGVKPFDVCPRENAIFRRLLLRAKPELNYPEYRELNYQPRRMGLFLSFSAINAYGIPSIWVRLRNADMKLLHLALSFL